MSAAQVNDLTIVQREANDCAIVAMARYLGSSYEEVLRHVSVTDRDQGRNGLWGRTMVAIAKRLGHTLRLRRTFDIDKDYGILRLPDHAAVLRNGLVFDGNGTVRDVTAFLKHKRVNRYECRLFVCED